MVVNSAIIVFREGLEAILIFAAVTAAMLGANRALRRPVAAGAGIAFLACIATWFGAQAILAQFSRYGDQLQAVTGLLAVAVLLDRPELVLPQGLLDEVDREAEPSSASACSRAARARAS